MLIFHRFKDLKQADDFAICVRDTFGRASRIFNSQEESDKFDPFPFELSPPIVLIERDGDDGLELEPKIEKLVEEFNGSFAGT